MEERNRNWPQIPNHIYKIWIIGGCGYGKQNSLFNLVCQQPDIDKTYLYAKDPYEAKYQFLILKLLSNIPMIWMIFIKILKILIQIKTKKDWSFFGWYGCWYA